MCPFLCPSFLRFFFPEHSFSWMLISGSQETQRSPYGCIRRYINDIHDDGRLHIHDSHRAVHQNMPLATRESFRQFAESSLHTHGSHLCLAKIPSVCKSGSILELGGSLGTGFRLKEGALRDLGSSRRQHKVGSARSAGTALPQFFFDSEAKSSRQRLRRPDRNDDADRRALASL